MRLLVVMFCMFSACTHLLVNMFLSQPLRSPLLLLPLLLDRVLLVPPLLLLVLLLVLLALLLRCSCRRICSKSAL